MRSSSINKYKSSANSSNNPITSSMNQRNLIKYSPYLTSVRQIKQFPSYTSRISSSLVNQRHSRPKVCFRYGNSNGSNNEESSHQTNKTIAFNYAPQVHYKPIISQAVQNYQPNNVSAVPAQTQPHKLKLTIVSVNNQTREVNLDSAMTVQQVKKYIFDNICTSLETDCMSLCYEGTILRNNLKLSEIQIVTGTQLKIIQTKLAIGQIRSIIVDVHGIDPISEEVGVAKMPCGHHIGTNTMTQMIKSLISSNKYEIRCPYPDENDNICNAQWEFKLCRKIGVFTAEQVVEFEEGLSKNWIKQNSKACPKCSQQICKIGLKTKRVVCSNCKYGDFCYMCLGKWRTNNSEHCGNEECSAMKEYLANCPWNKKFRVKNRQTGVYADYMAPQFRACPNCLVVFEHFKACKHMKCPFCGCGFCWLCLGTVRNGYFECGEYNEYCGKVAQAQKL